MPVGSEDVTETVDFWLLNTGGASAAACSSSSATNSLRKSRVRDLKVKNDHDCARKERELKLNFKPDLHLHKIQHTCLKVHQSVTLCGFLSE